MAATKVRLYFSSDPPWIWSLDEGERASERRFREVAWSRVTGRTRAALRMDSGDTERPRVWLEFEDVAVHVEDERAVLFPSRECGPPEIGG